MNVEHFSYQLNDFSKRPEVILKLLEKYSKDIHQSQAIAFCQTKRECNQLAKSNEMNSVSADLFKIKYERERVKFFFNSIIY